MNRIISIVLLTVMAMTIGCSKKPQQEIDDLSSKARTCEKSAVKHEAAVEERDEAKIKKTQEAHEENLQSLSTKVDDVKSQLDNFKTDVDAVSPQNEQLKEAKKFISTRIDSGLDDIKTIKKHIKGKSSEDMKNIIAILKKWKKRIKKIKKKSFD